MPLWLAVTQWRAVAPGPAFGPLRRGWLVYLAVRETHS